MRWEVVLLVLALAACRDLNSAPPAASSGEMREWVLPTGKPPSKAEFAALVAACQDRGTVAGLQPCLADYGVRRAQ